ncbi:NADH:ubiquinone oxidoreductase complex I intermediate-associated protein 30 [Chondrocystis sp. NIES-4102]|nr:NADH:ubiquinone oxidoreductase complex I intermediate-associated protein 30 [Chondrocystis sp. NIES-4102]
MGKWEFGRLWQTLTYFEVIPLLNWQRLFKPKSANISDNQQTNMVILVAGATGGVGKRVVKKLVEGNYRVRAIVRDAAIAREILPDQVELFEADITIPETLQPMLMEGVNRVICCTGTKVQPVEGDTPTREKYYQGIKFYMPEVVDTPELVEYVGIKNLINLLTQSLPAADEQLLFDFTHPNSKLKDTWGAVDDVVMGGVSQSNIRLADREAIFSGIVSTDNNGGFASVRTRNLVPPMDLSDYQGIELKVTGDGKRYKFITRCEGKWDGIGYCYSFDTIYDFPTTIRIPFKDLIPVFRAKTVGDASSFDASQVYSMQLMLSKFEYDGELNPKFEAGSFNLRIESIKAYGGTIKPQLIQISSAGVTRPNRPGLDLASEPPAVRMNEQLGGILTWKLRGEEVIRSSGLTYTIIRPCALTENPDNKMLYVEQGDNLKGQVSRDAIAQLSIEAMDLPQAVNKTFEVKELEQVGKSNWQGLFESLQQDKPQ